MPRLFKLSLILFVIFNLNLSVVQASPFIEADNRWLRADIQWLADRGVIKAPVTQWPIMWASISSSLNSTDLLDLEDDLQLPFQRVHKAFLRASGETLKASFDLSVANENALFREFGDSSREQGEVSTTVDWLGEDVAIKVKVTAVNDSFDEQDVRLDGSYFGFIWGNWALSAGAVDRWWGPGWKSSLILSNNARPIPAFSLQRNTSTPFESEWLQWIGPWTLETFMGQLESERHISDALLWGARFTFKPTQNLEIGLSRTAVWAGEGRPNNLKTFYNLLIGNDNIGNDLNRDEEPGNQQAGGDIRYSLEGFEIPVIAYLQYIGEDKLKNLFPSKATTQYGLETQPSMVEWGSYKFFIEYANTSTSGFQSIRTDNTIYEHSLYQSGYRYRGRVLGASWDNDSEVVTFGFQASNYADQELSVNYSYMDLNRDDTDRSAPGGNSITPIHVKVNVLDVRYRYYFKKSWIDTEITIRDESLFAFDSSDKYRISVGYHREF